MTHLVGSQVHTEFILDAEEALRRGAALDRLGPTLLPPRPRGVMRAPHSVFNAMDDRRQLEIARRLNGAHSPAP